jgi:threonine dehydrogenase-like Zn-dependent dehydrogenase
VAVVGDGAVGLSAVLAAHRCAQRGNPRRGHVVVTDTNPRRSQRPAEQRYFCQVHPFMRGEIVAV